MFRDELHTVTCTKLIELWDTQLSVRVFPLFFFPHSRTVYLDIIKVISPTDAQENCFKRSIKIYIKTAPTYFDVITIIRERTI